MKAWVRELINHASEEPPPKPPEIVDWSNGTCGAHLERRGELVPAYKMGLCKRCFKGEPLEWAKSAKQFA